MTNWTPVSGNSTNWSQVATNSTNFGGRETTDMGAILDDTLYTMDSLEITMDDMKLNSYVAPTTNWT